MKYLPVFIIAAFGVIMVGGCAYHGAVYSEYAQFALDVRSTAESSAPIKVDLGYDRGVLAYVPKLKGKTGEACSVISWQDIGSTAAPSQIGTGSVLRVDAGFISGTAAKVASAPSDATIVILPGPEAKAARIELKTTGGPGERITTALPFAHETLIEISKPLQQRREALAHRLDSLTEPQAEAVLKKAGLSVTPNMSAQDSLRVAISRALDEAAISNLEAAFGPVP